MRYLMTAGLAAAMMWTVPAGAQTLASSSFTAGDEGWTNGDFDQIGSTSAVIYNAAAGTISVNDNYGSNAFVAPAAYLGNKLAAIGGTLSWRQLVVSADGVNYAPLSLSNGTTILYARYVAPPGTTLTPFSVTLTAANFTIGGSPYGGEGTSVSDTAFAAVMGSLTRVAILADWQNGADFTTLDNVRLAGAGVTGAVPEPASWALMIVGFTAAGTTTRRRRTAVAFA